MAQKQKRPRTKIRFGRLVGKLKRGGYSKASAGAIAGSIARKAHKAPGQKFFRKVPKGRK